MRESGVYRLPRMLVPLVVGGAVVALLGGYWDDAWHTEKGRDSFLIAPHILIYGGVLAAGGGLAMWVLLAVRAYGPGALRAHPPLTLAVVSVLVTLASGPIDNAWHEAFGRDAVLWSPPHLLGIVGLLGLSAALLVELSDGGPRWGLLLAAGGALAAGVFPVVEYETDVPQFDEAWYLPALAAGSAFALALAQRATAWRYAATATALVHLVLIAFAATAMVALGFDAPLLPALVVPALALDFARAKGVGATGRAAVFTLALVATYPLWLELASPGVELTLRQIAVALAPTFVASWAAIACFEPRGRRVVVAAAGAVLLLALPPTAFAHDPGQGEELGRARLAVEVSHSRARLTAELRGLDCEELEPRATVARRAGEVRRGPLHSDGCRLAGEVPLGADGRWFVYAELERRRDRVETWLGVDNAEGNRASDHDRHVYLAPGDEASTVEFGAGALMYMAVLAFLYAVAALARRAR